MKTNVAQMIGFLLLGGAAIAVNAATPPKPATPPAPTLVMSTPLIHGGAMQRSGRCSVFNAGATAITLVDVHAEDGQGKVLTSSTANTCATKVLAGSRACVVTFDMNTVDDSAVCLAKIAAPKNNPKPVATGTQTTATPPAPPVPPAPMLAAEIVDNADNVLVYVNGVMVTPPSPPQPPAQGGNPPPPPAQGGTNPPPQAGTTPPPPVSGTSTQP